MATDPLIDTEELSEWLGVPVGTLHNWRWRGVGPNALRVGRWLRYRTSDVERWIEEQANKSASDEAMSLTKKAAPTVAKTTTIKAVAPKAATRATKATRAPASAKPRRAS